MHNDVKEVLLTEKEILKRVKELGEEISNDYKGKDLLIIGILKGATIFMSELIKRIDLAVKIDFMDVSSYGDSSVSTGEVKIIKDLDFSAENKHILIVEDIIDTGYTLNYLSDNLRKRGALSVKTCILLDKVDRRMVGVPIDYLGFEVPDEFIVGYGLDYAERYRNLPYVGTLKREIYGG